VKAEKSERKKRHGLLLNVGGAGMKRIFISVAIVLLIILTTLTLQSCFTPYPEKGDPQRESRDRDRDSGLRDDMHRGY
jgi:hypothetical protein